MTPSTPLRESFDNGKLTVSLRTVLVIPLTPSRALRDELPLCIPFGSVKNIAGGELASGIWEVRRPHLLDVAAKDCDILCVQEIAKDVCGWDEFESEHFQWITHRASSQWRGTGIGIAVDKFDCIVQKIATGRGLWVLARIHGLGRVVCGTLHGHTGTTNAVYQAAVLEFIRELPAKWRQYPLLCGIDANEVPCWEIDEEGDMRVGSSSTNMNVLVHEAMHIGGRFLSPCPEQLSAPTHFPRDENRTGRQIDVLLHRQMCLGGLNIDAARRHCIGSDHAFIFADVYLNKKIPKLRWGNDSRARWVVADLPARVIVDDEDIQLLAKEYTRPLRSQAYQDDEATKDAFRKARENNLVVDWKIAHKRRRQARNQWKQSRLQRILDGSWEDYRQLQNEKKRRRGWWGGLLADKSAAQLSGEVQEHLSKKMVDPSMEDWDGVLGKIIDNIDPKGDFVEFTLIDMREELQNMKCKSAVGPDGTGVHLLRTMASHDDLGPQLLALINQIVSRQEIPDSWRKSFLALLAKVSEPSRPGDLRPISVSSAFNKLVNRMVCTRSFPLLRRGSRVSACGKGRQAADLIGAMSRVRDVIHEWKSSALARKLDVAGAFDRVDRKKVANLLVQRLKFQGVNQELRYLLCQLRTHELHGKVPGGHCIVVAPNNGIKQGAPESAEVFGLVMDSILSDLTASSQWKAFGEGLPGLDLDVMFYQDDVFILEKDLGVLGRRVRVVDRALQQAGLKLATEKTKIISSAAYRGPRKIKIGDDIFEIAKAEESIRVLGVSFSFQTSPSSQAQELLSRTRAAAAAHRDLLGAKGPWSKKMHLMQILVESRFAWTAGALHWSSEDLRSANLLQLHTLRTAFNFRRHASESWVDWNSRSFALGSSQMDTHAGRRKY